MNIRKTVGITLSVIAVSIILLITFVFVKGYFKISPYLNQDTKIMPKIESTENDIKLLDDKYNILLHPETSQEKKITLTALEINLLLKNKFNLNNRLYVQFKDNSLKLTFSIPMLHKYLNGNLTANINHKNNVLDFDLVNMTANNIDIEDNVLETIESTFKNYAYKDNSFAKFIKNVDEMYIENNQLNIKLK